MTLRLMSKTPYPYNTMNRLRKHWIFWLGCAMAAPLAVGSLSEMAQANLSTSLAQAVNEVQEDEAGIALPLAPDTDGAAFVPDFLGVSDQPFSDDVRAIIGDDDRQPVLDLTYPFSAIGRLDWRDGQGRLMGNCTATLIGPDLILTNAHCLVNPRTRQIAANPADRPEHLVFRPALVNGNSLDSARVVSYQHGWEQGQEDPSQDWAILRLDRPLGNEYGYMGWRSLDFTHPAVIRATQGKLKVVGYAGDFPPRFREWGAPGETAGMHTDCSVVWAGDDLEGLLFHDCDTNPGASGGAIFGRFDDGRYYILGLHAGSDEFSGTVQFPTGLASNLINRGVAVSQWAAAALSMR